MNSTYLDQPSSALSSMNSQVNKKVEQGMMSVAPACSDYLANGIQNAFNSVVIRRRDNEESRTHGLLS